MNPKRWEKLSTDDEYDKEDFDDYRQRSFGYASRGDVLTGHLWSFKTKTNDHSLNSKKLVELEPQH